MAIFSASFIDTFCDNWFCQFFVAKVAFVWVVWRTFLNSIKFCYAHFSWESVLCTRDHSVVSGSWCYNTVPTSFISCPTDTYFVLIPSQNAWKNFDFGYIRYVFEVKQLHPLSRFCIDYQSINLIATLLWLWLTRVWRQAAASFVSPVLHCMLLS